MNFSLICKLIIGIDISFVLLVVYSNMADEVKNAIMVLIAIMAINIFGIVGGMYL